MQIMQGLLNGPQVINTCIALISAKHPNCKGQVKACTNLIIHCSYAYVWLGLATPDL